MIANRKLVACLLILAGVIPVQAAQPGHDDGAAMRTAVEADWARQEQRLGRTPQSPQAIQAAIERASRLLDDLRHAGSMPDLSGEQALLRTLSGQARDISALDDAARLRLYNNIRTLTRKLALGNPLVTSRPLIFMQRRRAVGYMLYEYLGWYYAYGYDPTNGAKNPQFSTPPTGGGAYVLAQPGRSMQTKELTAGLLPPGHFVTLSLSFDAKTVYFAFADPTGVDPYTLPGFARAPASPDTASVGWQPFAERRAGSARPLPSAKAATPDTRYNTFHIYAMNADGSNLRQLTDGPDDDFDPCPLPDGGIAFESTRRGSKLRCGGGSPELVNTLHRMDADGRNIRTLSFHETNEWHPGVLNDGRIVFTRWDYVDRDAARFHGLWTCNPDGTSPAILFGNYTNRPWACYQARAIPNSNRVVFVAGGHHANVGGTLVILDPSKAALDPTNGQDRFDALEQLTPEVCFAEAEGWPKSYFYSPWPLSENYFLVSFSYDPLPGGYTGRYQDTDSGLYYLDRFGNLELLFRAEGVSAVYPIPLAPRPKPPILAARDIRVEARAGWQPFAERRAGSARPLPSAKAATGDGQDARDANAEGEFLLADVTRSLLPLPANRRITHLRILQLLPKSRTDNADNPRISHIGQANARMLLGTVPVESDGSAYFRAPANKPLYFQAVDDTGRAVQGMRTVVYLQPGERRSCVGCHEPPALTPATRRPAAARREPSVIEPGPDGTLPFCYPRLIQPILNAHCVRCHDGSTGTDKSPLVLTGEPEDRFTRSYNNLAPYLLAPGDTITRPGKLGADISPLTGILAAEAHRAYVDLPDEQRRILYLWLDSNVPFFGTYEEQDLPAQLQGLAVAPPPLQ